jgi:hypothetical protein
MFHELPLECIFKIIDFLIRIPDHTGKPYHMLTYYEKKEVYGRELKQTIKSWEMPTWNPDSPLNSWKRPLFTLIVPLIMVSKEMKEIIDTSDIWIKFCEEQIRGGIAYKRSPKNPKKHLFSWTKKIINDRYSPILYFEKDKLTVLDLKQDTIQEQLQIIDNILPNIELGQIMITIPSGYINRYGYETRNQMKLHINEFNREIFYYKANEKTIKADKEVVENKIEKIEKIFRKM